MPASGTGPRGAAAGVKVGAPAVVASILGAAGIAWTIAVGGDDTALARSSALAIAIGFLIATVVAVTLILLVRSPLGRWLGLGMVVAGLAAMAILELGTAGWIAAALSAAAIVGLTGPWLRVWLRARPSAESVGWQPPALILGSLALTPLVGLAAPDGLVIAHGILAGCGILCAWAYAKAKRWGLWGLRIAIPIVAAVALTVTPGPAGKGLLASWVVALTTLAWTGQARRAITVPAPVLPAPHRRTGRTG